MNAMSSFSLCSSRRSILEAESDPDLEPRKRRNSKVARPKTHSYYTRLSGIARRSSGVRDSSITGSEDSSLLLDCNDDDRTLRNFDDEGIMLRNGSVNFEGSHLNPCSEPAIVGCGKCTKVGFFIILVSLAAIGYHLFNENYFIIKEDKSLKNEMNRIKAQVDQLKEHVQFVLRAKEDTTKIIDEVNRLFRDMKKNTEEGKCVSGSTIGQISSEGGKQAGEISVEEWNDKPDFALESAGATIHSTRDTEDYHKGGLVTLFGWILCRTTHGAISILQPSIHPGECWAFKGGSGSVAIKLVMPIQVSGVTLTHISKSMAPTNEISSAPKEFSVWGLSSPEATQGDFLGRFVYDISGAQVQYFPIAAEKQSKVYRHVEFKFLSNNGNHEYTCVYRVQVHGSASR